MADGPLLRALFRCHLWASARLMPVLVTNRSFEEVLRWAPLASSTPYRGLPSAYIVESVNRTVRHPWLMRDRRCLREGLLGHRFLRLAGFDPDLRFGVEPQ
ncbi:lasso peptide biosynthesis B2 protein, partial [Mesorhizobium sp. M7A.F.Ca.CA.003.01.2.1]